MLFLSHSAHDRAPAEDVRRRLLDRGYHAAQLFLDCDAESGIEAGDKWDDALYGALRQCRALIALCSMPWQQSKWCFAELVCAKAMGKAVFPVVLEPCDLGAVAGAHQVVDVAGEGEAAYARLWSALERQHLGPRDAWRPDPEERSLSREVVTAFRAAIATAEEWRSGFVGVPHLLAGLSAVADGVLSGFLRRHAIPPDAWQETLRKTIKQLPFDGRLELTEGLMEVFGVAQEAVISIRPEVNERALLRSIFEIRGPYLERLTVKAGIPLNELRPEVMFKVTPEEDW